MCYYNAFFGHCRRTYVSSALAPFQLRHIPHYVSSYSYQNNFVTNYVWFWARCVIKMRYEHTSTSFPFLTFSVSYMHSVYLPPALFSDPISKHFLQTIHSRLKRSTVQFRFGEVQCCVLSAKIVGKINEIVHNYEKSLQEMSFIPRGSFTRPISHLPYLR